MIASLGTHKLSLILDSAKSEPRRPTTVILSPIWCELTLTLIAAFLTQGPYAMTNS